MTEPKEPTAEEKLREKIAQEIGEWRWKDSFYGEYVTENDRNSCRTEVGLVLDLIKEAGYESPEEVRHGKERVREAFRFPKIGGK